LSSTNAVGIDQVLECAAKRGVFDVGLVRHAEPRRGALDRSQLADCPAHGGSASALLCRYLGREFRIEALSSQLMALGAPRPEVDHLFGNMTDIPREDIIRAMATRPETMGALFARIRAEYASLAGLLDGLGVPVSLIASLHPSPTTAEETAHSSAGLTAGCSSTTADPPGRQPMRQSTS